MSNKRVQTPCRQPSHEPGIEVAPRDGRCWHACQLCVSSGGSWRREGTDIWAEPAGHQARSVPGAMLPRRELRTPFGLTGEALRLSPCPQCPARRPGWVLLLAGGTQSPRSPSALEGPNSVWLLTAGAQGLQLAHVGRLGGSCRPAPLGEARPLTTTCPLGLAVLMLPPHRASWR